METGTGKHAILKHMALTFVAAAAAVLFINTVVMPHMPKVAPKA
jgi:hypothetical protein